MISWLKSHHYSDPFIAGMRVRCKIFVFVDGSLTLSL